MRKTGCCIFDLDGTLLYTLPAIAKAGNSVLAMFGHPVQPVEDYAYYCGDGADTLVRRIFDKVGGLAKKARLRPVGERSADDRVAELEERLLHAVNATGVGPAGLGGDTTALDVHINTAPCHIAAVPVAINMGCCAMRSISLELEEA